MAASGFTPISLYYSTTASAVPTSGNLANGELGLNIADMKLYAKNSAGTVTLLASNAGASGSVTSVAATVPAFLSIAGSPITTSGTLAITLSGTALPIANGGTGTTSTTFANLTTNVTGTLPVANGGTGVTTSTGTGSTVLSASPTFTGTPLSTTAALNTNTTQIATTAFVVSQIGAISAGVSSFSAGTTGFTPSTATTGAVTLAGTLATTNGGTGLTSFTSGGVVYASSTSALATGSALYFDGTNLGIGTTSPNFKLETRTSITVGVNGTNLANNTAVNSAFIYTDPGSVATGDGKAIAIGMNARARVYISATHPTTSKDSSDLALWTTSNNVVNERLKVLATGEVGIGNTAPTYKLDVSSSAEVVSRFLRTSGSNALIAFQDPTSTNLPYIGSYGNALAFGAYGLSEYGRFISTGFLGIGTTSPATKLHIASGAVTIANVSGSTQALLISANDPSNAGISLSNTSGPRIWNIVAGSASVNNTDFTIRDATAGATRFVIDTSGNVGIGTNPATKLQVLGTTNSGYASSNAIVNAASSISNSNSLYDGSSLRLTANMGGAVNFTGRGSELVFGADNGNFGAGGGFGQANLGAITAISETGSAVNLASSMLFYTVISNNIYERLRINSSGAFGLNGANYGTSGQVLTSGGSGAAPSWASPAGGGSWVFLSTVTASGAATADVETTFDSTYDAYAIVATNILSSTNGVNLWVRLKIGGTYQTSLYSYGNYGITANSASGRFIAETSDAKIIINSVGGGEGGLMNTTSSPGMFTLYTQKPSDSSTFKLISGDFTYVPGDGGTRFTKCTFGGRYHGAVGALTGIRFLASAGNITGTFRLYGIKNS